ncbi:MAG: hypothetical protein QME68_02155 [Elusimicrobiota bacterium]|nr:hypothetical protein [Elusimicrobiota bacterium]
MHVNILKQRNFNISFASQRGDSERSERQRGQSHLWKIAEQSEAYFEELVKHQPNWCSRAIKGIIALAKEYSIEQVDIACKKALHFGVYSYRVIKSICEQGIRDIPAEETAYTGETVKSGEYQRPLEEYELYLK